MLATIGRRAGVAEIFGVKFSGIVAWCLWRAIYWSKLPGLQNKVRVSLDWALDLVFSKDIVQLPTLRSPTMSRPEEPLTGIAPESLRNFVPKSDHAQQQLEPHEITRE
jgi:NADH dehydrogenase